MKKIIFFVLLSVYSITSWAQTNMNQNVVNTFDQSINESVYIHLSNTSVLVGETIFYRLYNLNSNNHTFSTVSKISYIEIVDSNGKSIVKQKLLLENGVAQGDIFIPTSINSGSYKLIGYTNWMLNYSKSNFFETNITIINPFQSKIELPEFNNIKPVNTNKALTIKLNKNSYNSRENVKLTLNSNIDELNEGKYSISVRKVDELIENNSISAEKFITEIKGKTEFTNQKNLVLPELRGETIKGKITATDGSTVEGKAVSLSIPGKSFEFKLVNTNKNGEFIFILDELPNSTNAIFQVVDDNRKAYKIDLINSSFDYKILEFPKTQDISSDKKAIIEKRSIANQIENAYFSIKKDTVKDQLNTKPFYTPLEKTISLDDYTRFSSLKETIVEILPNTFFKEKDGIYTINLRDKLSNGVDSGYTLILVDGLLIQDVKEIFEYNTKNIEKIDYITDKYVYGSKIFNGVINFITKNQDYELKDNGNYILKTEIQRPVITKYYYKQDYSDSEKYKRIPDYRYQLLWIPDLVIENQKTITFYTSDIKGNFEIAIEGFTKEGKPISLKEYFEVK